MNQAAPPEAPVVVHEEPSAVPDGLSRLPTATDPKPTLSHTPAPPDVQPPPSQDAAANEAANAKTEALTAWKKVKELDRGQGLGLQLDAIYQSLKAGESHYTAKDFGTALTLFQKALAQCQDAETLDAQRQEALKQRLVSDEAAQAVTPAAKKKAPQLWTAAEQKYEAAKSLFDKGKFMDAAAAWTEAAKAFAQAGLDLAKIDSGGKSTSPIPFDAVDGSGLLAKVKVFQVKSKVQTALMPNPQDISIAWCGSSKFKTVAQSEVNGKDVAIISVVNGEKGWRKVTGLGAADGVKPLTGESLAYQRTTGLLYAFSNLALLKKEEKEFEFRPGADEVVKGHDCFAVHATRKGLPEIDFFFDKKTRLLAKVHAQFAFAKKKFVIDYYYSDYQNTKGVLHWRKMEMYSDGVPYSIHQVQAVLFFNELDDSMFSVD
jgi:hypothetical protein